MKLKRLIPLLVLLAAPLLATPAAAHDRHGDRADRWGARHIDPPRAYKTERYIHGCKITEKFNRKGYKKKVKCKRPRHWRHGHGHGPHRYPSVDWTRDRHDDWRYGDGRYDTQRHDGSQRDEAITDWRNPDDRRQTAPGDVAGAGPCREINTTATIAGRQQQLYGQACRQPDGAWKFID